MDYNVNSSSDGPGEPNDRVPRLTELPFRALGGQPPFDAAHLDTMVSEPRIAVLAYRRKDGRPNQVPVWYAYDDGIVLITIATGSAKHHALEQDPRISMVIHDERPPYRAAVIEGTAELSQQPEDDRLSYETAVRYFGKIGADEYWKMTADQRAEAGTTLITVVPGEVKGFDNTRAVGRLLVAFARIRNRLPIPRSWL